MSSIRNTVARAYADLTREGLLEARAGRGVFITRKRKIFSREEGWRRLEPLLEAVIGEAMILDYTPEELRAAFTEKLSQWKKPKGGDGKMNEPPVIQTRGLTRYFGSKAAVYELDLDVPSRLRVRVPRPQRLRQNHHHSMLMGLVQPTRGSGSVLGQDIRKLTPEIRARIGYLTEEHQLYTWMKVKECGEFQSAFFPRWNDKLFRGIIGHFGLKPAARVKDLSRGERAGLCLALTLAPDPELLILDDPGLGLDPVARRMLVESMIYLTRKSDRTIFFSSHDLSDVERVADYIAVFDRSVLRACCPLEKFQESIHQVRLTFDGSPPPLPNVPGLLQAIRADGELRVTCVHYNGETEKILRSLSPTLMETVPLGLEEAFINYLGDRGGKNLHILSRRNGIQNMNALFKKDLRENFKLAIIGLVVLGFFFVLYCRHANPGEQPSLHEPLLATGIFFCAIFGSVLGWLQARNEATPDLWAFLVHRPHHPHGKSSAPKLRRPACAFTFWARACLSLACFATSFWLAPVAAPFEPSMILPSIVVLLMGIPYYFAGYLTGLEKALRWAHGQPDFCPWRGVLQFHRDMLE